MLLLSIPSPSGLAPSMLKLTARSRVNLMFVVGLALLITAGFVTYSTFLKQAEDSDWVSHTYRNLNQLEKSRDLIQKMQVAQRDHRLNKENTHALSDFSAARTEIESNLKTLNQLMADNPAQVMRLATVEDQLSQLYTFWTLPENAVHSIQTVNRESNRINAVRTNLDHLVTVEQNLLTSRESQRESAFRTAGITILVAMTLAILIATLLILVVYRELKQRQEAQHELKSRLNDLSQLHEETAQKNWLLTGVSKINDSLQVTHDLDSLAQCIVQEVTAYLEVPAGALYVLDKKSLVRRASVGLPSHTATIWPLDSGLLGKAAASKHIQRIQKVPPEFWQFQSSTGALQPGEVLFLPLWNGSNLKGVLELAAFGRFSESCLLLLETAGNNIAVALDASMSQESNNQLLTQVQLQTDALLEQQETLKQTNEELTRQAEILQASEEELKVQEEELRQVNVELEERNEAIEAARRSLTIKARELEQSSQYKSEFLANMSHELRTPLNSVLILARLLADNKAGNLTDKQIEHAQVIFRSGTDLLNLINDILDLSKIEAGKIDILIEEVKTASILRNMQDLFSVLADDKGIRFRITTDDTTPESFYSDHQRIEQILKNLLSNAFKFTPRGGTIQLSVQQIQPQPGFFEQNLSEASEVLAFSVEDSGIGIALEKQKLIFEAFQQADGSTNRKFGGTGLGLSICRELSRLLGGEIRVNSEMGRGSTFTLYLPAQGTVMPKELVSPMVLETQPPLLSLDKLREQTQVPDDRQDLVRGDHTLLIIEDDAVYAERLRDLAQARGYKTVIALTGAEGLHYARTYRPTAILLDIFLPDTDGWSMLKTLKNDPDLQPIPVHIISAGDEPRHTLQGAVSFLSKTASKDAFETVFARIAEHLPSTEKKILVLTGTQLRSQSLTSWLAERNFQINTQFVTSLPEALLRFQHQEFHCLLMDAGEASEAVLHTLEQLHTALGTHQIPFILFLDQDLSPAEESRFKKVSDVIIRNSPLAKDRLLDELELFLFKIESQPVVPKATVIMAEKALQGKKILVVDDDMRNVFSLSTLLEEYEMNTITAGDGRESLEVLRNNPDTDLILMDVMMPEMDGYEAIQHIRADPQFQELPIIALTAKAMQGDREKSIQAGASDYISKPVDSKQLLSLLRVWLSRG